MLVQLLQLKVIIFYILSLGDRQFFCFAGAQTSLVKSAVVVKNVASSLPVDPYSHSF